jgi:GNAT superfamily N-acetyltransferase
LPVSAASPKACRAPAKGMSTRVSEEITIRPAAEHEVPQVLEFIRELAVYERLEAQVVATETGLKAALFGPRPYAEVIFACLAGRPVGFALFFHNFSTFLGKPGIYLEDLFVRPAARGMGIGRHLLAWLAPRSSAAAAGSTGRCSTGMSPRSAFTAASAPSRRANGRRSGSPARHWLVLPRAARRCAPAPPASNPHPPGAGRSS